MRVGVSDADHTLLPRKLPFRKPLGRRSIRREDREGSLLHQPVEDCRPIRAALRGNRLAIRSNPRRLPGISSRPRIRDRRRRRKIEPALAPAPRKAKRRNERASHGHPGQSAIGRLNHESPLLNPPTIIADQPSEAREMVTSVPGTQPPFLVVFLAVFWASAADLKFLHHC